jgi:putative SOS response-associated peptidase YedK
MAGKSRPSPAQGRSASAPQQETRTILSPTLAGALAGLGWLSHRLRRPWHLPIVRYNAKEGHRALELMRWGLVPYWAKDIKVSFANIKCHGGAGGQQAGFP